MIFEKSLSEEERIELTAFLALESVFKEFFEVGVRINKHDSDFTDPLCYVKNYFKQFAGLNHLSTLAKLSYLAAVQLFKNAINSKYNLMRVIKLSDSFLQNHMNLSDIQENYFEKQAKLEEVIALVVPDHFDINCLNIFETILSIKQKHWALKGLLLTRKRKTSSIVFSSIKKEWVFNINLAKNTQYCFKTLNESTSFAYENGYEIKAFFYFYLSGSIEISKEEYSAKTIRYIKMISDKETSAEVPTGAKLESVIKKFLEENKEIVRKLVPKLYDRPYQTDYLDSIKINRNLSPIRRKDNDIGGSLIFPIRSLAKDEWIKPLKSSKPPGDPTQNKPKGIMEIPTMGSSGSDTRQYMNIDNPIELDYQKNPEYPSVENNVFLTPDPVNYPENTVSPALHDFSSSPAPVLGGSHALPLPNINSHSRPAFNEYSQTHPSPLIMQSSVQVLEPVFNTPELPLNEKPLSYNERSVQDLTGIPPALQSSPKAIYGSPDLLDLTNSRQAAFTESLSRPSDIPPALDAVNSSEAFSVSQFDCLNKEENKDLNKFSPNVAEVNKEYAQRPEELNLREGLVNENQYYAAQGESFTNMYGGFEDANNTGNLNPELNYRDACFNTLAANEYSNLLQGTQPINISLSHNGSANNSLNYLAPLPGEINYLRCQNCNSEISSLNEYCRCGFFNSGNNPAGFEDFRALIPPPVIPDIQNIIAHQQSFVTRCSTCFYDMPLGQTICPICKVQVN